MRRGIFLVNLLLLVSVLLYSLSLVLLSPSVLAEGFLLPPSLVVFLPFPLPYFSRGLSELFSFFSSTRCRWISRTSSVFLIRALFFLLLFLFLFSSYLSFCVCYYETTSSIERKERRKVKDFPRSRRVTRNPSREGVFFSSFSSSASANNNKPASLRLSFFSSFPFSLLSFFLSPFPSLLSSFAFRLCFLPFFLLPACLFLAPEETRSTFFLSFSSPLHPSILPNPSISYSVFFFFSFFTPS